MKMQIPGTLWFEGDERFGDKFDKELYGSRNEYREYEPMTSFSNMLSDENNLTQESLQRAIDSLGKQIKGDEPLFKTKHPTASEWRK